MPKHADGNPTNHIKHIRLAKGLSQEEVAKEAGISRSALHKYESAGFDGRISHIVRDRIATALGTTAEEMFRTTEPGEIIGRRDLFATMGIGAASIGAFPLANMFPISAIMTPHMQLGKEEIQNVGNANFATWSLFDSAHSDMQIEYVKAVTQGNIVAISQLAQMGLIPSQKTTLLNFLADMYLLIGRIHLEQQNYTTADQAFQQAEEIALETQNRDLLAAMRQRYSLLYIEQERYMQAATHAKHALAEINGASHALWAEARYIAAESLARTGEVRDGLKLLYETRESKPGGEPEYWFGKLRNMKTNSLICEIVILTNAQKNAEAIRATETAIQQVKKDEPDNVRWISRVETLYATALWQSGAWDQGLEIAMQGLLHARQVNSIRNEATIEKLYQKVLATPYRRETKAKALGHALSTKYQTLQDKRNF